MLTSQLNVVGKKNSTDWTEFLKLGIFYHEVKSKLIGKLFSVEIDHYRKHKKCFYNLYDKIIFNCFKNQSLSFNQRN